VRAWLDAHPELAGEGPAGEVLADDPR